MYILLRIGFYSNCTTWTTFFFFAPPLIYANVYKMNGMKGYEEREKDRKKRESEREGEKDRERVVLSVLEKTFKIIIFVVECIFFF